MRRLVTLCIITGACISASGVAQYRSWRLPKGVVLPGDRFIECIVPEYSIRNRPFTQALRDVGSSFGLRIEIQIVVSTQFRDPIISVEAKQVTVKELINRIVRASGFAEGEWNLDSMRADVFHMFLGRDPGSSYPLATRIGAWTSPDGESPENVLNNILRYIPEMRRRFYGQDTGWAGSRFPVQQGCILVYRAKNSTVLEIIRQVAQTAGKSWLFVYVSGEEKSSRFEVF